MRGIVRLVLFLLPVVTAGHAVRAITIDERVAAQQAIEDVYWRHRLWPKDNARAKPALDAVLSSAAIETRVQAYLKKSRALETVWHRPITRDQLQAELDRMARDSRDPKLLQELFDALGNDADLIGDTLARQTLAERLIRTWQAGEPAGEEFDTWWKRAQRDVSGDVAGVAHGLALPPLAPSACALDTWSPTHTELPDGRTNHYAVWTGTEMIVWGGTTEYATRLSTGGRYNPATDTWVSTSTGANAPPALSQTSVVWTGAEMIVWGGWNGNPFNTVNIGARYDPLTDTWSPTSTGPNVPTPRYQHTAVWTGSEMIVWGGRPGSTVTGGGRYDPVANKWTPISTPVASRAQHSAVWTGSQMIVWGGQDTTTGTMLNTGAQYAPSTDSWTPISTGVGVPTARENHAAVWTGSEMIVWGGIPNESSSPLNTGGRYNPATDTWSATSVGSGVPPARSGHATIWTGLRMIVFGGETQDLNPRAYDPSTDSWTVYSASPLGLRYRSAAVWTGSEMIVWGGGINGQRPYNTGARFSPSSDSWVATGMGGVPVEREAHSAVWTGTEMIVWGGRTNNNPQTGPPLNSGGRYTPATDSWIPTTTVNAPAARQGHAAVWTGSEMIVFAGRNTAPLNSGGRYNPLTDTWLPTSIGASVPTTRNSAIVVWSGKEMIVFGDATITGGRYDPAVDAWTTTAVGPTLFGGGQTAVWAGAEMIVWQGGFGSGGRYSPVTNSWTAIPAAPLASRIFESSVWTGTEMIVWGGGDTSTGARYNPASNTWTLTSTGANVASVRSAHTAVWTGREMLIWGGANAMSSLNPTRGSRYDPLTDSWQPMSLGPDQPTQRTFHTAIWTGSQMIVWGGQITTATGGAYCACPDGRLVYRDIDGDGYGNAALSMPSCDGGIPVGYAEATGDCDESRVSVHPGAQEGCNGLDDNCNGLVDEDASGVDTDGDGVHNACDNCPLDVNASQSDFDHDGEGDQCDLNDGLIYIRVTDPNYPEWQPESGFTSWNSYRGSLAVLRATGQYTQAPGSNPLAARDCGLTDLYVYDGIAPDPGEVAFQLVTGVADGIESGLGTDSAGALRPNAQPCP